MFGQRLLYSGKNCSIPESGSICIWLYSGKSGCIREKVVVFGQIGCIRVKWLYTGKVDIFGQMLLYSGKNGCIRTKVVVVG